MKNTHRSSSKVSLCFADLHILSTTPVGKQHCYNVKYNVCLHILASLIEHTDYEPLSVFIQKHRKHIERQLLILGKQKSR